MTAGSSVARGVVRSQRTLRCLQGRTLLASLFLAVLDLAVVAAVTHQATTVVAVLVVDLALGTYRHRYHLEVATANGRFAAVWVVAIAATPGIQAGRAALLCVLLVAARLLGVGVVLALRRRHPSPILLLGSGAIGQQLATALWGRRVYGLEPVAFATDDDRPRDLPLPCIPIEEAARAAHDLGVRDVVCAFDSQNDERLVSTVRQLRSEGLRVAVVPRLFEVSPADDHIWGYPVVTLPDVLSAARIRSGCKRVAEVVMAAALLALFAPVAALVALAVKLSSPGPVLYRQKRLTVDGRPFEILKFRTMAVGSDRATTWTIANDPRRTRVGTFLRRTSLDEVPQLVNVLRGEMSLVGPRPEQVEIAQELEEAIPGYRDRLRVRAGITGLAQVYGLRGDSSLADRVRFDNRYIDRHNTTTDVAVLARTVLALLKGENSY